MSSVDFFDFKPGDLVQMIGGVIVVTVAKGKVNCAPLPYHAGEPVICVSCGKLRHLSQLPPEHVEASATL